MCGKTSCKIFTFIIIAIALILAILVSVAHQQALAYIIYVSRFFDVMLPILAVGALVKFLMTPCGKDSECCKRD